MKLIICFFLILTVGLLAEDNVTNTKKNDKKISKKLDQDNFEFEIKKLETDVNLLKEKIFRSKARLSTLHETLISGKAIQGAKLSITHIKNLSHFRIKEVIYHLDGKHLFASVDVNGKLEQKEINLYNDTLIPGNHIVSVMVILQVVDYGIFSYAKGYTFKIKSSHSFYIEEGKVTSLNIKIYEKGGYFSDLTQKPNIVFKAGVTRTLSSTEALKMKSDKDTKKEKKEK